MFLLLFGSVVAVNAVGEFELMRLHYILNLRHSQLTSTSPPLNLHISFLSQSSFGRSLAQVHEFAVPLDSAGKAAKDASNDPAFISIANKTRTAINTRAPFVKLFFRSRQSPSSGRTVFDDSECAASIYFHDCDSLEDAICRAPIRSIFFCDMMVTDAAQWTVDERAIALKRLLNIIAKVQQLPSTATIVPPASWDALVERKNEVHAKFYSIMIPTRWETVPTEAFNFVAYDQSIMDLCVANAAVIRDKRDKTQTSSNAANRKLHDLLCKATAAAAPARVKAEQKEAADTALIKATEKENAAEIAQVHYENEPLNVMATECELAFSAIKRICDGLLQSQPNGTYYVKGSRNDCGLCVRKVEVKDGESIELETAVLLFINRFNQPHIGLQVAIPQFEVTEFRHWCVAVPELNDPTGKAIRFRYSFSLRTSKSIDKSITAAIHAPLSPESIACYDLVQRMLSDDAEASHKLFFQQALDLGIPAIRIDCGFDFKKRSAFLNEFAIAPDANMWTGIHHYDLLAHTSKTMSDMMWQAVQQQSSSSPALASSSSSSPAFASFPAFPSRSSSLSSAITLSLPTTGN